MLVHTSHCQDLAGNKLTFKATAFEARKDATYRVKIKATPDIFLWILLFSQTTEKTIVDWIVTVMVFSVVCV
jgi:hypothetical protein